MKAMALARSIAGATGRDIHKLADMMSKYALIDLSGTVKPLPESIFDESVEVLRLVQCGLMHLSSSIGKMRRLRDLNIAINGLRHLPHTMYDLPISNLVLDNNSLGVLSNRIADLPLVALSLGFNGLSRLPQSLSTARLKLLNASGNSNMYQPTLVRMFDLDTAAFNRMHWTKISRKMSSDSVSRLELKNNRLTSLEFIQYFPNLVTLLVDDNPITQVDVSMLAKSSLQVLSLKGSCLSRAKIESLRNHTNVQINIT